MGHSRARTALGSLVATALLLTTAGCTGSGSELNGTPEESTSSAPGVQFAGLPDTYQATARDAGPTTLPPDATATGGAPLVIAGSHTFELTPAGPLPQPATVTITLGRAATANLRPVVATRETPIGDWTYLRGQLNADRTAVTFTTDHFSWFSVLLVDAAAIVKEFKETFIDGLTSGVTATAAKPSCKDEAKARADGFRVRSSSTQSVYWCLGYEPSGHSTRVLKLVNNRPYPLMVAHPNMSVLSNHYDEAALAAVSRSISGPYAIIEPRGTAVLNADLGPGEDEGIETQFDGLGQSLYALQTGIETLLTILTKFGAGADKKAVDILDVAVTVPKCLSALTQNVGAVVSGCFSAAALMKYFGTAGLILAPIATVGGVVQFFVSEFQALADTIRDRDHYQVTITREGSQFRAFEGTWTAHTAYVEVDRNGRAVERIGNGCCDRLIDVTYQLSNPHKKGSDWYADGTVVTVAPHDTDDLDFIPQVGHTYPVHVSGWHYYSLTLPTWHYCGSKMPLGSMDCGA